MNSHLVPLTDAVARVGDAWADAGDATGLSRPGLIAANEALASLGRVVDALKVEVAAGIAHESRRELGPDSLAKQQGFRSPVQLIAVTTGASTGDAARLVKLGEVTAPRVDLAGSRRPAKYPAVQEALTCGRLGAPAASLIVTLMDRMRLKVGTARTLEAEALLVDRAQGLSLDEVRKLLVRAEAWVDPDGVEPRQEEVRAARSVTMFERDGTFHLNAVLDVEAAAPVRAAIGGYVTAVFAARKNALAMDGAGVGRVGAIGAPGPAGGVDDPDADRRTLPQLQADALSALCAHALDCDQKNVPALAGATVVVRVTLEDLQKGTGSGVIDGTDQPVSIGAVRRMAASGGIIPAVLGGDSAVLDWGRRKRLFTRAQRLALVERDGGCAMCGLPPQFTRAHHIHWWDRDTGPTDLANGVLLCESCHHRIHDNGWDITIDPPGNRTPRSRTLESGAPPGTGVGATSRVWFIPPAHIDPHRTPRLGGNARYTLAA